MPLQNFRWNEGRSFLPPSLLLHQPRLCGMDRRFKYLLLWLFLSHFLRKYHETQPIGKIEHRQYGVAVTFIGIRYNAADDSPSMCPIEEWPGVRKGTVRRIRSKDAVDSLKDSLLLISSHPGTAQLQASDDALPPPLFGRHGRVAKTWKFRACFLVRLIE